MGHDGVASSYSTPTGFRRLTGYQWDPLDGGVTHTLYGKNISGAGQTPVDDAHPRP